MKVSVLAVLAAALIGCSSYEMKSPENFDAEPIAVTGKTTALRIGDYQLSDFERSWTKGSGMQIMSVKSEKRRQAYQFRLSRAGGGAAAVHCEFSANERTVGVRSGWELMAGEGARLKCNVTQDGDTSKLELETESDEVLTGTFKAARTYRVEGVGTALFSKGRKGPTGGFHIYEDDRIVALAQVMSPKRVLFARASDSDRRAELVPAIAALLLLDESVREF